MSYAKTVTGSALAVTPGITYSQTGSIVIAGLALLLVGGAFVVASRLRRRHDDSMLDR